MSVAGEGRDAVRGWTIALCTDNEPYHQDRFKDPTLCRRYPGALWMARFTKLVEASGAEVHSGDVALARIRAGEADAARVIFVSEQHPAQARDLLALGAVPGVSFCGESPLFVPDFYDSLPELEGTYRHLVLFGEDSGGRGMGERHRMYFPCYESDDLRAPKPWLDRKLLSVVAGMKLFQPERSVGVRDGWKPLAKAARAMWRRGLSLTRTAVYDRELQTRRFEAMLEFLKDDSIQIFGRGWGQTNQLPVAWRRRFEQHRETLARSAGCEDKIAAISAFKFNLCFENVEFPGYVTEKIIDCFVAGTIPVYWGAPDAERIVPRSAYVDAREFAGNWGGLKAMLERMPIAEAEGMLREARRFLMAEEGMRFTHEAFAGRMLDMLGVCASREPR